MLLGRAPSASFAVAVRGPDGVPVVIENAPFLDDGRPMPTRYWLVDRRLSEAVSRLEAAGGVRQAEADVDPGALAEAHARYAAERDAAVPAGHVGPRPSGGVGGTRRGVKCLHAHLAWYLAGGADPVGRWTAQRLGLSAPGPGDGARPPAAALDCGTNSTRLLVVADDGTVLERVMRITRLGEGVDASRTLGAEAVGRTLAVLGDYRRALERHAVGRARLVATSAVRDAANGADFLRRAEQVTGVHPELLSGSQEASLSFAGATARLPPGAAGTAPVLVVDIGGGSTELVVGRPGAGAPEVAGVSLDVGCVRVTERFLAHDPPLPTELAEARRAVRALVDGARRELPTLEGDSLLVGLAGTVSTVAMLEQGIARYDRARVHHAVLGRPHVEWWLDALSGEDGAARLARPGMVEGRQDVIVGGVLVLAEVMAAFDRDRCLVSEDDILDGLVASLH